MSQPSTSSIVLTCNIFNAALKAGADKEALLAASGLDPLILEDSNARVFSGIHPKLMEAAIQLTGDELLGLHAGEWATPEPDNLHAFLVLNSPTLRIAIKNAIRYYRMLADETYQEFLESKNQSRLIMRTAFPIAAFPRSIAEWTLSNWSRIIRVMLVEGFSFQEVRFQHEEIRFTKAYEDYFQAPVQFGQPHNGLVFSSDFLDKPIPNAQPMVADMSEKKVMEILSAIAKPEDLHGEARRELRALLKTNSINQNQLAQKLGMTQRTLQRRLKDMGFSYRDVLKTVRMEYAIELLQNRGTSIADVTSQLGFASQETFYRAFSRWYKMTPKMYRVRQEPAL